LMSSWAHYYVRKVSNLTITDFYYTQQEEIRMAYDNADGSFTLYGAEVQVPLWSAFCFDPCTPNLVFLQHKEAKVFKNIRPATRRQITADIFDLAPGDASLSLELFTVELSLKESVLVTDIHKLIIYFYESYTYFSRILGYEMDSYNSQIKIRNHAFVELKRQIKCDIPYHRLIYGTVPIRFFALTEDPVEYRGNIIDSSASLYIFCCVADYPGLELRFTFQTPAARTFMGDNLENLRISKFVGIHPRKFLPKSFFMMLDVHRDYTVFRIDPIRAGPKGPYFVTLFDSSSILGVRPLFLQQSKKDLKSGARWFYPDFPFCKTDIAERVNDVNLVMNVPFKNSDHDHV